MPGRRHHPALGVFQDGRERVGTSKLVLPWDHTRGCTGFTPGTVCTGPSGTPGFDQWSGAVTCRAGDHGEALLSGDSLSLSLKPPPCFLSSLSWCQCLESPHGPVKHRWPSVPCCTRESRLSQGTYVGTNTRKSPGMSVGGEPTANADNDVRLG